MTVDAARLAPTIFRSAVQKQQTTTKHLLTAIIPRCSRSLSTCDLLTANSLIERPLNCPP
jgi:hypothetical protein